MDAALMAATTDLRFGPHARLAAHVERSDPFRFAGLGRGQGHEIDLELAQNDLNMSCCLCFRDNDNGRTAAFFRLR